MPIYCRIWPRIPLIRVRPHVSSIILSCLVPITSYSPLASYRIHHSTATFSRMALGRLFYMWAIVYCYDECGSHLPSSIALRYPWFFAEKRVSLFLMTVNGSAASAFLSGRGSLDRSVVGHVASGTKNS